MRETTDCAVEKVYLGVNAVLNVSAVKEASLRASTKRIGFNGARGFGYCYKGVWKDAAGSVVWTCCHEHSNRDDNQCLRPPFSYNEFPQMRSALNCARVELQKRDSK